MSHVRTQWSPPRFSPTLYRWFLVYLRRYARRHFDAILLSRDGRPAAEHGVPTIVYSNHPSWWDPILFMILAGACFPGREGYGPMDAEALGRYGIFRRLGVFGVERGTRRGAAEFLRAATWALQRPDAVLWLTAGGEFADARRRPQVLAPGLAHIVRSLDRGVVVPLALEYCFWNERHPEALARFGEPLRVEDHPRRSTDEWSALLAGALESTMDGLADEAIGRDPRRFEPLLDGRKGVGGVYDDWRRLRAALQGQGFHAAHGGEDR